MALAPDLFEGKIATTAPAAKKLRAQPKREPTYKTLIRAIEELGRQPAVQGRTIGVIGFSMGGHWALWLSQRAELPIGAVVTFYGARSGDYSNSRASFLGHFAEEDGWVSDGARRKLQLSLERAGRDARFFTYPGTGHWFFESDRPDAYDFRAAERAWRRSLQFLRQQLRVGRSPAR